MDSSLSLSKSVSKGTAYEEIEPSNDVLEEMKRFEIESISNEQIRNGDLLLETYMVTSDPISGGMGSVWRVHHQTWDADLAMKRPHPKYFAEGSARRKAVFIDECKNWINLGLHPNVVSCYYVREIGGVPTIFSEWMDGGSLKDRIADGSLYKGTDTEVRERILDIALQASFGLQYSHENNLVHQDMKPGNLLLTEKWDAKIGDFGLANAVTTLNQSEPEGRSGSAALTGYTLEYCPAEQAAGVTAETWMDVYAWALTVLEMYAGKRLWETGAAARDHFEEYPAKCRIRIPEKLAALLKTCLSGSVNSFKEMEESLSAIYSEETGKRYLRPTAKVSDTSDILNNKALSFIDLGMPDRADELLQSAIKAKNDAENAVFNYALLRWRRGQISDDECLQFIREHLGLHEEKCGAIEEERGIEPLLSVHEAALPINKEAGRYELIPIDSPHYLGIYETKDHADPHSCDCFYLLGYKKASSSWEIVRTVVSEKAKRYDLEYDTTLVAGNTLLFRADTECLELYPLSDPLSDPRDEDLPFETISVSENDIFLTDEAEHIIRIKVKEKPINNGLSRRFHAAFYENPEKLRKNTPYRKTAFTAGGDDFYQLYAAEDRLFYVGEKEITVCELPSGKSSRLYSFEEKSEAFVDALCRKGILYVLTNHEILIFDKENCSRITLGHPDAYCTRLYMTPDERYLIATFTGAKSEALISFYDTTQRRCIATYCDSSEYKEWAYAEVKPVDESHIAVHIIQKIYDVPKYGEYKTRYEYCIKEFPVPAPGQQCSWQLSRIRSFSERLEADRKFENALSKIRQSLADGNAADALKHIKAASAMEGYEQDLRLWALNRAAGQGKEITGIRYVRPVSTAECPLIKEAECHPVGKDLMLIRKNATARNAKAARKNAAAARKNAAAPQNGTEYQLYRWTTGERLFAWSTAADSVWGCLSSDDNYAVILEQIGRDHFTIVRLSLQTGAAERIPVSAALKPGQFEAASHGRRIVIVTPGCEILADKNAVVRITDATGGGGRRRLFSFSRNGKYLAAVLAGSYEGSRTSVLLYTADAYFKGAKEPSHKAAALGMHRLSVSDSGEITAQFDELTILFCPDRPPIMVRCVTERGEERYLSSSFAPDEAGITVLNSEGDLLFYRPKTKEDYQIRELGTDHRSQLVYTGRSNIIELKKTQTVYGSDKIDVSGEAVFSGGGSILTDAGGALWIIDYEYSDQPQKPLQRPSKKVKERNLMYSKELKELMAPELERRDNLIMFLKISAACFALGLFSLFFFGKLAPDFVRQTVWLGWMMLGVGAFALLFGLVSYFFKWQ